MSAATKLKMLDLGPGSIDDAEFITMGYEGLLKLRNALPQIRAAVEALDWICTRNPEDQRAMWDVKQVAAGALAALDEALS